MLPGVTRWIQIESALPRQYLFRVINGRFSPSPGVLALLLFLIP